MLCNTCQVGQWVPVHHGRVCAPWERSRQSHLGTMLPQSLPVNSNAQSQHFS